MECVPSLFLGFEVVLHCIIGHCRGEERENELFLEDGEEGGRGVVGREEVVI